MVGSFHEQEGALNSFTTIHGQTWETYLVSTTEGNLLAVGQVPS